MATNLDTAILLGKEVTYGTPVALTTAYEGQADSWKREHEYMESRGFRAGLQAKLSTRRKLINMGGTGNLEFDVLDKGFGFVAQAMLGSSTGPTQEGATAAYSQVHETTTDAPGDSYTVQVQRITATGGAVESFTHHGAMITGWSLSQEVNGFLMASLDFDFEDVDTSTGDGTASYPSGATAFDWTQCVVSIDSVATDMTTLSFEADLGLKTDRRFLRGSELKKKPVRSALPTYSGSMTGDFESTTIYDLFVSGEIIPITFTWTGSNIEGAFDNEIKLTLAACQLIGDSPEASIDDLASQPVSFEVLYNGTDPAVKLEITSTDTSL